MAGLGLGASEGGGMAYKLLQDLLVRRFKENQEQARQENDRGTLAVNQGRLANDTAQTGINRDTLTENTREHTATETRLNKQWNDDAPIRISTARAQTAQAEHNDWDRSDGKRTAEQADSLARIHATGNENVREANARAASTAAKDDLWVVRPNPVTGTNDRILINRRDYRQGDQPGDTRSMGQHVIAGDANRLGEISFGLSQLRSLSNTLTTGTTGTKAALQANLPNFIAGPLGVGAEAKERNAQIMLVKQVIGKGLEGGVLRAEDEPKYQAMLPTMTDMPEVAQQKMRMLSESLEQKWDNHLNSLEDAGYDVTKFRRRHEATTKASSDGKSRGEKWGY